MKKRILSILWWWFLVVTALGVVIFDMFDVAAAAKSSISKRNDNSKLISSDKNVYGKGDKSLKAGDGDIDGVVNGGGDIIPIPDHLLNSDYEHQYSYEDENVDGFSHEYSDYEDEYHHNTGKHKLFLKITISFRVEIAG